MLPPDVTAALFSRWDVASLPGTIDIMDTLLIDQAKFVESDLADIGGLPLAALASWRGSAIRAAIRDAVRTAGPACVCDQQSSNDWTN